MLNIKNNLWVVNHPFAQQELTKIRDKNTDRIQFRKGLVKLGRICGYELMKILDKQEVEIETPLEKCKGIKVADADNVVLINVLRAATPFVEGLLKAFPSARQGVISARRIENENGNMDFNIEIRYSKFPEMTKRDVVIIADPMLASGSTLIKVVEYVKNCANPKKIIALSVLSSEFGMQKLSAAFPDVSFVTIAIDPRLNEHGYILPGLGDAGDRTFG